MYLKQLASRPRRDACCIEINAENTTGIHILRRLALLTEISPETFEISASQDVNFPCETLQVIKPSEAG